MFRSFMLNNNKLLANNKNSNTIVMCSDNKIPHSLIRIWKKNMSVNCDNEYGLGEYC
jgi:TPP-dependent trihydroxycyclohexane-1,2-dione (THcHDO) dehydratase